MVNWSERQLKAIETADKNLLVSAAAGSGKTAVLVERITRLIMSGKASVDRMLVVTFTNAAAAEMKEKIYKSLNQELASPGLSKEKRKYLINQLALMGTANISTFSSFAIDVVHSYYHIIGADPGLKVADPQKAALLKAKALDKLFTEKFSQKDEEFTHFLDCYASPTDSEPAKEIILELSDFLDTIPYPEEFLEKALSEDFLDNCIEFAKDKCLAEIDIALKYYQRADRILKEANLPNTRAKLLGEIAVIEELKSAFEGSNLTAAFAMLGECKITGLRFGAGEKDGYALVSDSVKTYRELGKDLIKHASKGLAAQYSGLSRELLSAELQASQRVLKELFTLTAEYRELYGKEKQQQGLLDFADAESFAIQILRQPGPSSEYKEKFKFIFVDEYQDSNLIQEELISLIAGKNNLFMVGDVKQSIYKFRKAEPEIFLGKYNSFKSGNGSLDSAIDLNANFRSKPGIIDFVNGLFEKVMNRASCGIDYDADAALIRGAELKQPEYSFKPEIYLVNAAELKEAEDEEIAELANAELEARLAAEIIRKYYGTPIYDEKEGHVRTLEYRDMVILKRNIKGSAEVYYRTLLDAGIPVYFERSEGYFDTFEIQVFLNLLRIIDNRQQDIPLLSVLKSPVFGFNSEELAAIRIFANSNIGHKAPYNQAFDYYAQNGENAALKAKCSSFLTFIDRKRTEAKYTPAADFIWKLLHETGYTDYEAAKTNGAQSLANLKALADKAAAYEAQNAGGLFGFISYVEMMQKKGAKVDIGQASTITEAADCVRIMSIHKSKGLEFPFVLLAGLGEKLRAKNNSSQALFHSKLGAAINLVNPKTNIRYSGNMPKIIKRKTAAEEDEEIIRILYVAMTRPKDILVMSACVKTDNDPIEHAKALIPYDLINTANYFDMIVSAVPDITIHSINAAKAAASAKPEKAEDLKEIASLGNISEQHSRIEQIICFPYIKPDREKQKNKYSVSALAEMARTGIEPPHRRFSTGEEDDAMLSAAERGTAYHTVMEHLPFTPENKDPESIRIFIEGLRKKHILTDEESIAVDPETISKFFSSPIGKRAMAASELHKEAPFILKHNYKGRDILVQGTIDCYFKDAKGFVLLDYKTNFINPKEKEKALAHLKETYIPQLELYKEALESILEAEVKESYLYLFGINEELRLT